MAKATFGRKVFAGVLLFLLWLPLIQMRFHVFQKGGLAGVKRQDVSSFKGLSWLGVWRGEDQARFEKWFALNSGFREDLIKLHNQLIYSLFAESPTAGLGEGLVLGKQMQIFGIRDVEKLYEKPYDIAKIEEQGDLLLELQYLLKKRGVEFIVLLTPNKASLYSEFIPDPIRYSRPYKENVNYEMLRSVLEKRGVNLVDGFQVLKERSWRIRYPLYPRGGYHWNDLGAYYVLKALLEKYELLTGRRLVRLVLNGIHVDWNGHGPDMDGADTLNLKIPPSDFECPRPLITAVGDVGAFKPRLFFEGGSYNWILLGMLRKFEVVTGLAAFFYYESYIDYSEPEPDNRLIQSVDWEGKIFNQDAVVYELNLGRLTDDPDNLGQGFIRDAIIKLKNRDTKTKF